MKPILYDESKRQKLLETRGIDLEEVKNIILAGGVIDTQENLHYANQKIFIIIYRGYHCAVPFVDDIDHIFIKTAYLSRKLKKLYPLG